MHECKSKEQGFYVGEDASRPLAEISYYFRDEETIVIDHTIVSDTLRGQGVGGMLVRKVIEKARKENLKVIPLCPYAKRVMIQNPDYQDVLSDDEA
ncbi:GNAT family N-acetyltransferase [Sphaerochaeta sp. PS]|uniref:GNAT family N-acetyltransferase n=1 Tax=Sphaerochaeta sp. PS TaxID=3076336 RepID=UPI0028A47345|nr:GNAT family N-acetyltransferase [Sphaerochaeta sp. PS]MDT4762909.1 GNAT family N-acetyltransferase [Sphaerochaeta sp. PS]